MTNDNNSKILRLIPAPSTRIKDLSESSVARPPGHGRDYFLSFLSDASTSQPRQRWQRCRRVVRTEDCSWHTFHPTGKETIAISLLRYVGQGTFAGHCDLWRPEIVGAAGFAISLPQLPAGSGAGGVLNGSAECSQSPSLGSSRKRGFMLLLPEVLWALKDTVYMLIRQSGVDPEIVKHHSYYCRYIGLLLLAG